VICVICIIYIICNRVDRVYIPYGAKGFLRRMVVYLKDHSPYLDSSLFIVNLRIQLELIYWATTPLVVITLLTCLYLYTRPNNRTYRSSCYKVPLHLILYYYNLDLKLILETDASNRVVVGVLLQLYLDGK